MSGLEHGTESSRRTEDRLARLLGPGPRHAGQDGVGSWDGGIGQDGPERTNRFQDELADEDGWSDLDAGPTVPARTLGTTDPPRGGGFVRRFFEERFGGWAFGPPQLAVIVVIVLLGLGLAGWSVLRARPVALAAGAPGTSSTATPKATTAAGGQPTSPPSPVITGQTAAPTSSTTPSAAPLIKVHVLGAVRHPGVVTLAVGARVQDALDRAGGVTGAANLGDLNLAQPIADGQQIFVARGGGKSQVRDPVSVPAGGSGSAASDPTGVGSADTTSGGGQGAPVNLNTATVDQLDQLPGVGPVTAQKIVDWRTQHGRFDSTEQLQEVDGIGPKTYADLAAMVTV